MVELLFKEEVFAVQGAIFNVSRELGVGFPEAVYQECLAKELPRSRIPFRAHPLLHGLIGGGNTPGAGDQLPESHRTARRLLVNFGRYPKARIERFAR